MCNFVYNTPYIRFCQYIDTNNYNYLSFAINLHSCSIILFVLESKEERKAATCQEPKREIYD